MSKENASSSEILDLCDRLRDEQLVELGVQLDDQEGKSLFQAKTASWADVSKMAKLSINLFPKSSSDESGKKRWLLQRERRYS